MEQIISEIIMQMTDLLPEQGKKLENVLYGVLSKYEITPKSTEVRAVDSSWEKELEWFLSRKRIAGKSEMTIKMYNMQLRRYLQSRKDENNALFVSLKAPYNRMTVSGIEQVIKSIGKRAGIEKTHPHRFRRTMATNVLKKGMPLEEVKELLGHVKLDTTMIYCTVSKDNVRNSHRKYMCA